MDEAIDEQIGQAHEQVAAFQVLVRFRLGAACRFCLLLCVAGDFFHPFDKAVEICSRLADFIAAVNVQTAAELDFPLRQLRGRAIQRLDRLHNGETGDDQDEDQRKYIGNAKDAQL